jgi:hypothetical protein
MAAGEITVCPKIAAPHSVRNKVKETPGSNIRGKGKIAIAMHTVNAS